MIDRAHIILFVEDQQLSKQFYEAVFGQAPSLDVPGMTEFEIGESTVLGLMPRTGARRLLNIEFGNAPQSEIYLLVDDPEQCVQRALSAGATLLSEYTARDWGDYAGYIRDPDGHIIAFAKRSV